MHMCACRCACVCEYIFVNGIQCHRLITAISLFLLASLALLYIFYVIVYTHTQMLLMNECTFVCCLYLEEINEKKKRKTNTHVHIQVLVCMSKHT